MKPEKRPAKSAVYIGVQNKKPVNTDSIEAMKAEDDKMVSGQFNNLEARGQDATVVFRARKGQPIFVKTFFHGEVSSIPLSVARFINTRTSWPRHRHELDTDGNHTKRVGEWVQRYQFVSREFT